MVRNLQILRAQPRINPHMTGSGGCSTIVDLCNILSERSEQLLAVSPELLRGVAPVSDKSERFTVGCFTDSGTFQALTVES